MSNRKLQRFVLSFTTRASRHVLLWALLCALVLQPLFAWAQVANVSSPWTKFTREADNLVSNNVLSILVGDNELWFGADEGISHFTGLWESFDAVSLGLRGGVRALTQGEAPHSVWAGADSGQLLYWDGSTWSQAAQASTGITALLAGDGRLWVGVEDGLYVWTGAELMAIEELQGRRVQALAIQGNVLWVGTDQGLWTYQRGQWSTLGPDEGLPGSNVTSIWIDPKGPVWVAADGNVAWRNASGVWTPVPTEVITLNNPDPTIALVGDNFGDVWGAAYGSGAFRIREGMLQAFSGEGENGLTTPFVQALAVDQDGLVWFGTASGVFRFDGRLWQRELGDAVEYPGINRINDLAAGPDNQIWIATGGAGIRLKPQGMSTLPERLYTDADGGLPTNFVTSVTLDATGAPWAGTFIGVVRYDAQTDQWSTPPGLGTLPSELVTDLQADNQGMWIGTDQGLVYYDLLAETSQDIPALADYNVTAMAIDSLGRLWVGTGQGLFLRGQDNTWVHFSQTTEEGAGLLGDSIVALAPDPNVAGAMWVAVQEAGINYYDGSRWHDYTDIVDAPSKLIYRLYTDGKDGSLWIGSEGGVTHYDKRTSETLSVTGALPAASVLAIVQDAAGNYWFGGRDGLTFHRPETTPPWVHVRQVNSLPLDQFLQKPQIQADEELILDYIAGDLYTQSSDLRILYRITGPAQLGNWEVAAQRPLVLTDFQEGSYLIELQARDQSFNYSEVTRLNVDVAPPPPTVALPFFAPVRRDYFIALAITGFIALVGFAFMTAEIVQARRRTREAVTRGFNPFVSGEPVRREDMFFGREDLLQKIIDTLHNNSIMIHGERRIGKTTLLYQLAARLRELDDPEFWFIPLYVDLEGTTEKGFFHFLMEEILNGISTLPGAAASIEPALENLQFHELPREEYSDREFSRDLRRVIRALEAYGQEHHPGKHLRLILLMDEMDVMSDYSRLVQQRLRRIFMRDFAVTLGAVVAGIQISKEWDRIESPWYNLFNEIELTPFTREQALELLVEPVEGYYSWEPAALEFVIEHSEGRPYRLQQYALEAVHHMLQDGRRTITLEDVEQAHDHIQRVGNDLHVGIDVANGSGAASPNGEFETLTPMPVEAQAEEGNAPTEDVTRKIEAES